MNLPRLALLLSFFFPLPFLSPPCRAQTGPDLEKLIQKARERLARVQAQARREAAAREKTREKLLARLLSLEKEDRSLAGEIEKARKEREKADLALSEAQKKEQDLARARGELVDLLSRAVPSLLDRTQGSLASLGSQEFRKARSRLEKEWAQWKARGGEGPFASLLEAALDLAFSEVREGGRIRWVHGIFPGPEGPPLEANLLRVGLLGAAGPQGILVPQGETFRLARPGGWFSGFALSRALSRLAPGQAPPFPLVPLDVTGGLALAGMEAGKTPAQLFTEGGPVMYFILLAGIMGLLISLFRGIGIWREGRRLARLSRDLPPLLAGGRREEAAGLCRRLGGAAGKALETCLQAAGRSEAEAGRILDQALLQGALSLERFLGTLAVLGTLAPFLGLLGTVTGMIRTFSALTASGGGGGSAVLAGGIAEALITTEFGLIVAIPLVLLHSILSGKAERVQADLEEQGARVALVLPGGEKGEED